MRGSLRPAHLAVLVISIALGGSNASAAPGDIDTSFGSAGVTSTAAGPLSMAYALAEQADGKVIRGSSVWLDRIRGGRVRCRAL